MFVIRESCCRTIDSDVAGNTCSSAKRKLTYFLGKLENNPADICFSCCLLCIFTKEKEEWVLVPMNKGILYNDSVYISFKCQRWQTSDVGRR